MRDVKKRGNNILGVFHPLCACINIDRVLFRDTEARLRLHVVVVLTPVFEISVNCL